MVRLGELNPSVWDRVVEYMEFRLQDIEFQGEDIVLDWRKSTDANRLEREIFAKYGYFKDIILHPTFQEYKQWFEDKVSWDVVLDEGESLAPFSVIVIILSILYSRLSKDALALVAAFLFNINPIYVVIIMFIYWLLFYRGLKPKKFRSTIIQSIKAIKTIKSVDEFTEIIDINHPRNDYQQKIVKMFISKDPTVTTFDHILIGSDISTLYTAAILARVGHKCLVLEPIGGPQYQYHMEGIPSIPLLSLAIGKPDRYQHYFDLVQSKKLSSHRVTFQPLGREKDGYTHTVLRILPPSYAKTLSQKPQRGKLADIVSFRAEDDNINTTIASAATKFDKMIFKTFKDTISSALSYLHSYLITKVLGSTKDAQVDTISKTQGLVDFINLGTHNIGDVLDRNIEDPLVYGILHGLSVIGSEESLPPSEASGLGLALSLANSEQGYYYPVGGLDAIQKALIYAIRIHGGQIISNVNIKEINMDELEAGPKVSGVTISISHSTLDIKARTSVISGVGVLATYTRLIPSKYISNDLRTKLSPLTESRPKIHIIYAIDSTTFSGLELGLHSADYIEVGSEYESIRWLLSKSLDPSNQPSSSTTLNSPVLVKESQLIGTYCRIYSPSMQDPRWHDVTKSSPHIVVVEFELIEPAAILKPYRFSQPYYKSSGNTLQQQQQSTSTLGNLLNNGPKVYTSSYTDNVITFSLSNSKDSLGDEIRLSKTQQDKIVAVADMKLKSVYPKLFTLSTENSINGLILRKEVASPRIGGFKIASTPAKYGAKLSAPSDIQGLYLCGRDIASPGVMGDIQGAWAASNAVLGYSAHELIMGRNITTDMENIPIKY